MPLDDSLTYRLLKTLQTNTTTTQRGLAKDLGLSLGKTNYCVRALVNKGLIKAERLFHSQRRTAYVYMLTPKGLEEKSRVTLRFLKRKIEEYENIHEEINQLKESLTADENETLKDCFKNANWP